VLTAEVLVSDLTITQAAQWDTRRNSRSGELGNVGTTAVVANAVYHAMGVRIRQLPIRIESW